MHCPVVWVSIIIASAVSVPLPSDEITLFQTAANAKIGVSQAKTIAIQSHEPICSEPEPLEARLGLSVVDDKEPLVVPIVLGFNTPEVLASSKKAAAPAVVLGVRTALWLLSFGFFVSGAMRFFSSDTKRGSAASTFVNAATDFTDTIPQRGELHKAALAGDESRCETLLLQAAEPLAAADAWGTTPLHAAASSGAHVVAELFLEHGAPVDPTDAWDETPLHLAAREGHVEVCEILAKRGASLRAVNAENWTALVVAANAGQEAVCRRLLAFGAGVESLSEEELPDMLLELIVETMAKAPTGAAS